MKDAFASAFGASLLIDSGDRIADPASRFNLDPEGFLEDRPSYAASLADIKVVHGHFHPQKYADLPGGGVLTTVLRDPMERALSHYFYWLRVEPNQHAVWRYVIDNKLDFPSFCRLPWINSLISGVFFKNVDIERLELVGFSDQMNDYLDQFEARFGVQIEVGQANATESLEYASAKARYLEDAAMRARLAPYFEADQRFYDTLRKRFA
jgi:hypothetical protein